MKPCRPFFLLWLVSGMILFLSACHLSKGREDIAHVYPSEVTALDPEEGEGLPVFVGKDLRPVWKLENTPEPRVLMPFRLTDQPGHQIGSENLRGKVSVI